MTRRHGNGACLPPCGGEEISLSLLRSGHKLRFRYLPTVILEKASTLFMCDAKIIISEALPSEFYYVFPSVDDLIKQRFECVLPMYRLYYPGN